MHYPKDVLQFRGGDAASGEIMSMLLARGYHLQSAWRAYDAALESVSKLMGREGASAGDAARSLGEAALAQAVSQVGVTETAAGSNAGPEIDTYLASVGLEGDYAWRTAFVHWCFARAASTAQTANPFPRTAGALDAWNMTPTSRRISRAKAMLNPALVKPGLVFVLDLGAGAGHAGLVRRTDGARMTTIEGTIDPAGDGAFAVCELRRRTLSDRALKGFLDLG